jgi:hypothetical protein
MISILKIMKPNSLQSYIQIRLTVFVLIGSSCGGKDHTAKPPEFLKLQSEIVNKSLNNVSISQEEMRALVSASLGSVWIRLHPESLENIPTLQQAKPGLPLTQ